MEEEKRKSIRVKKQLQVSYSRDGQVWDVTVIRDFSEAGMQIAAVGKFSPQEAIFLRLLVPFRPFDPLQIKGQILCASDFAAGFGAPITNMCILRILFVDVNEAQKTVLQEYIKWFVDKESKTK